MYNFVFFLKKKIIFKDNFLLSILIYIEYIFIYPSILFSFFSKYNIYIINCKLCIINNKYLFCLD